MDFKIGSMLDALPFSFGIRFNSILRMTSNIPWYFLNCPTGNNSNDCI